MNNESQALRKRIRDPDRLGEIASELRKMVLRMVHHAGSGHVGGSLSCIDMLACLYFGEMRHYPFRADWPARDRFVLSKGHAAPALYAILARSGYIASHDLLQLRSLDSILQGHPDSRRCPGIEASTGSLGQGLSVAHGMALALRDRPESPRVYVLLGDGELQEGQVWEAAMSAGHYRTHTLCALIDANGLQLDGAVRDVKNVEPIGDKFAAFGWNTIDIDGHDMASILQALDQARDYQARPTVIIARTVKGKGVSFIENDVKWHGKVPNDEQLQSALEELNS
uniref:Transketolase subunit A n=1 Tax=Candidatus Kentrum sp. SD TaxID=2126332 RepID=A0A450YRZ3_9GAMM|nr:MAG: transketolase subunit A [Candidatus Kentron sp. SD]VFK44321.1 MAG: transketolase subunit A [Candidatus Kentron sp. SD]VFK79307.1 MAG: transketolase subunit A [Candidatus Kentron sp. SD]